MNLVGNFPFTDISLNFQGFVDVWSSDAGTEPIYTLPFNTRNVTSLALRDVETGSIDRGNHACVMAAAQGTRVQASYINDQNGHVLADFDMPGKVSFSFFL